jgi:hypothetical protein
MSIRTDELAALFHDTPPPDLSPRHGYARGDRKHQQKGDEDLSRNFRYSDQVVEEVIDTVIVAAEG